MKKKVDKPGGAPPSNISLNDAERPVARKGSADGAGRKIPGGQFGGKQQWVTDIMIIFLLLSGAILLYHFNKQSEQIELMKKQAVEAPAPVIGKKGF